MNDATMAAIVAAGTAFFTYFGPKLLELLNTWRGKNTELSIREFDDAVVRRKELIEEIHVLREEVKAQKTKLDESETKYWKLWQDYVELKAKYEDSVQELSRLAERVAQEPPLPII